MNMPLLPKMLKMLYRSALDPKSLLRTKPKSERRSFLQRFDVYMFGEYLASFESEVAVPYAKAVTEAERIEELA